MAVLAIIPARSGSKSLPNKNIRSFRGTPLLGLAAQQAHAATLVDRVIVSTDDEYYAAIAREYGAETPFLRPANLAGDLSTDLETFEHALRWYKQDTGELPEIVVHLRPTYPNRTPADIDAAVGLLREHPEWDAVRSVSAAPESPLKMWWIRPDGTLEQVADAGIAESHSLPRQALPTAFLQNACVDAIRPSTILERRSMTGCALGAYIMDHHHDIDTLADFDAAADAAAIGWDGRKLTICCDMDGIIATLSPQNDYALARPQQDIIAALNTLHRAGNRIVIFTARGSATRIDWTGITLRQLQDWGVSHDELRFGKPAADIYVDDRGTGISALLRLAEVVKAQS